MCKFALLLCLSLAVSAMAKDVMLMNRIGPSKSELYVANADGTRRAETAGRLRL